MKRRFPSFLATRELRPLFAAGAGAFLLAGIAGAPASLLPALLGFEKHGVRYENAQGSFWRGSISGVSATEIYVGDIDYRIRPAALLRGALSARLTASGGALVGKGDFSIGLGGLAQVNGASFGLDLGALRGYAFLGEPLRGDLRLEVERLAFSKRGCRRANADIWSDILEAPARRIGAPVMPLSGALACDGDDLLASLSGDGEEGRVALTLRVTPALTYQLDATAEPKRLEMREALQSLGFRRQDDALTIGTRGAIRSAGV